MTRATSEVSLLETELKKLKAFVRGEQTWAEAEGIGLEEASAIAAVGCDLASLGKLEEAKVLFEGLVAVNPKDSAAYAALGMVYQRLGRLDDALDAYRLALEWDPKNPIALANRGELRLGRGDGRGAVDLSLAIEADLHGETSAGRRARALMDLIGAASGERPPPTKAP